MCVAREMQVERGQPGAGGAGGSQRIGGALCHRSAQGQLELPEVGQGGQGGSHRLAHLALDAAGLQGWGGWVDGCAGSQLCVHGGEQARAGTLECEATMAERWSFSTAEQPIRTRTAFPPGTPVSTHLHSQSGQPCGATQRCLERLGVVQVARGQLQRAQARHALQRGQHGAAALHLLQPQLLQRGTVCYEVQRGCATRCDEVRVAAALGTPLHA